MRSLMVQLWELLKFWKKTKSLEAGKDFMFFDFEDTDLTGIYILREEYGGVIYYYTEASVVEEGIGARLKFGYQIVKSGEFSRQQLEKDEEFVTLIGDILSYIITTEQKIESTRTIYSEESDL